MRNISFALTTGQFYRRQKTVTRRLGWQNCRVGELLCGVQKGMGLALGQSPTRLAIIRVVDVRRERLDAIGGDDIAREGFPGMSRREFVAMFRDSHESCRPSSQVTRLEFRFVPGARFEVVGFCKVCGFSDGGHSDPDILDGTCHWVDSRGLLSRKPTTLCNRCYFVQRFNDSPAAFA